MVGLDTNVLVRYLAQDDVAQSAKATEIIESLTEAKQGFISQVVLIETVWVMQRVFDADRQTISSIVQSLLNIPSLIVENTGVVRAAVELYMTTSADFADCMIAKVAEANGCDTVLTFDVKAGKSCGMQLID